MLFTLENRELFKCTKEEKELLVPLVREFVDMSNIARSKGILALEEKFDETEDKRLENALKLVVYGTETDLIREVLEIQTVASHEIGINLLRQIIVIEGAVLLSKGYNPRIVEEVLFSFLGDDLTPAT